MMSREVSAELGQKNLFSTSTNRSTKYASAGPDEDYGNVVNGHDPLSNLIDTEIRELETVFLNKLKLTENEILYLDDKTKTQHQCDQWHLERKKRLTASLFGRLCKLRESTSRVKIANEILHKPFKGNAATRYGIEHEMIAIKQLENKINKKIVPSGLMVDLNQPFLAASPDGLIGSDSLVEIKCPASAKDMTPEEGIISKKIKSCEILDDKLHLKRNHNYYYQVQGQLHIARRMNCYFCIWTPKGFLFEIIERDDTFWNDKMATQLTTFYMDFLLKQLIKDELK
uniref:YqaJ viral recombinase domain-containing protein n=1 Tax=Schizaphis graminum TaxID=13262 RepID=A0A2S2NPH1_SCHGA